MDTDVVCERIEHVVASIRTHDRRRVWLQYICQALVVRVLHLVVGVVLQRRALEARARPRRLNDRLSEELRWVRVKCKERGERSGRTGGESMKRPKSGMRGTFGTPVLTVAPCRRSSPVRVRYC